ncbi:MAG: prolyl aminopeptidase [Burkholderiaceae bacterium]
MLYPSIEPFARGMLDVGQGHSIYWEQCGNPQGQPIVFLHGGPGAGCTPKARRWFNPQHYRVVLLDQRGCGRSTPHASTQHNTLEHLVQDLEQLRKLLRIEHWLLCGGSWGSTLALAYTRLHRTRVQGLVLRGVFTAEPVELDWLYKPGGVNQVFPQPWQAFASALGAVEPTQLLNAYAQQLHSNDVSQVLAAALAWCAWEDALSSIHPDARPSAPDVPRCLSMARISSHMFMHDPWLGANAQVWSAQSLLGLPGIIVQGQFDMVTPAQTAWSVHQAWPGSQLRMVHEAGHATADPALGQALVCALDEMATMVRHPI